MEFAIIDEHTFQAYGKTAANRNVWQSVMMCRLREKNGWHTHYVSLREDGNIVAACALVSYPVFRDYCLFQAMRGFLIDYEDAPLLERFSNEVIAYIRAHKGIHFSMDPYVIVHQRDKYGKLMEGGIHNEGLVTLLRRLGYTHRGFDVGVDEEKGEPRWMYVLPLAGKDEQTLLKDMNQLTRRCIKKTKREGFSLVELKRNELNRFRDIITQTAKRKGFSDRPLSYYETMYDVFGSHIKYWLIVMDADRYLQSLQEEKHKEKQKLAQVEANLRAHGDHEKSLNKQTAIRNTLNGIAKKEAEVQALKARYGNEIVLSGAMFLLYGDEVIYLSGGSYEHTLPFSAQYRLQWEMISYAVTHGYARYNFYGISGHFDEAHSDGVLSFKQGFSGEVHELVGTFEITIRPSLYHMYTAAKGIKDRVKG